MLRRQLLQASWQRPSTVCLFCSVRSAFPPLQIRPFSASALCHDETAKKTTPRSRRRRQSTTTIRKIPRSKHAKPVKIRLIRSDQNPPKEKVDRKDGVVGEKQDEGEVEHTTAGPTRRSEYGQTEDGVSIKAAMAAATTARSAEVSGEKKKRRKKKEENLPIEILSPDELDFRPVDVKIPPVPMLAHGLDRVLFNPGVYRLQDPRSRVYNFDPYLEMIMPVKEFDFSALSEYKTSSQDTELLAITKRLGIKFTGSTSSMSGVLTHFHYLLSNWRPLNNDALSHNFPDPSQKFSKIQRAPTSIFLRHKDGTYAVDADKSFDTPNIMSWLGHSLEKLLTNSREDFERYRRSSPEKPPLEDRAEQCYHYSQLGNFLMRSQLDAHDPRLPGTGVFDLKTRAVVTIRMNAREYEAGLGYQLRYERGEWESFEREFYDMTRATMLKYSLQVRMGRMDGIFVAFHNIERMFGFQYISLPDMDNVLHGQTDTSLGNQEFKLSIRLLDEILQRATQKFPDTSIRLHFETREGKHPFMYIFAQPVSEEEADALQNKSSPARKAFERNTIGVRRDDPEIQAAWQDIQESVDEEVSEDEFNTAGQKNAEAQNSTVAESVEETAPTEEDTAQKASPSNEKPIWGWTLTIRNRVNGEYVPQPKDFTSEDTWSLEYYLRDVSEDAQQHLFKKMMDRQKELLGTSEQEVAGRLKIYREILQSKSKQGRRWRDEQDKIDEQLGKRVYRPMGPGAEDVLRHWSGAPAVTEEVQKEPADAA